MLRHRPHSVPMTMDSSRRAKGGPGAGPQQPMTLAFRIGPVPVRLGLGLLLATLAFGLGARHGLLAAMAWTAGLLATLFVHELAHAATARMWGAPAEVHLTLFRGGRAPWMTSLSPLRRMLAYLSGPASNLGIAATAFGLSHASRWTGALNQLAWMNLAWGALNLLPVLPLDGGHALVALLGGLTKRQGERPVRWLSVLLAAALGIGAAHFRAPIPLLICVLVGFQNASTLLGARGERHQESLMKVHLQAAFDALENGETAKAVEHCRTVLAASRSTATRKEAVRMLSYASASS